MSTSLALEITSGAQAVHVRVRGDVDIASKAELEGTLEQLGVYNLNIEVDLRGVTFMDSTGLSLIVHFHRRTADTGRALTIIAPSEQVRRLFEIAGVDGFLTIIP